MKIALITVHNTNSYGANLQAYATYKTLVNLNYDVEMIDYVSPYDPGQKGYAGMSNTSFLKRTYTKIKNAILRKNCNDKKAFSNFHKIYRLSTAKECYYDVAVSGSDQLWNPDIFEQIDENYFLENVNASKYISYAASCGSHVFTADEKEVLKRLLKKYSFVSVREHFLGKQLKDIVDMPIKLVCDPTFLFSKNQWLEFANVSNKKMSSKYILLYLVGIPYKEYKAKYYKVVKHISEYTNLPVCGISPYSFISPKGCKKRLVGYTPHDFVKAIDEAELVITSSFHGVAFSINMNKQFVVLSNSNPARINQLLETYCIKDRIVSSYNEKECERIINETIAYDDINKKIDSIRVESLDWLKNSLTNDE